MSTEHLRGALTDALLLVTACDNPDDSCELARATVVGIVGGGGSDTQAAALLTLVQGLVGLSCLLLDEVEGAGRPAGEVLHQIGLRLQQATDGRPPDTAAPHHEEGRPRPPKTAISAHR